MHPVGPRPPGVYWLRRVVFIVVVIAALVAVIFLVVGRSKGGTPGATANTPAVSGSAGPTLTGVLASRLTTTASSAAASTRSAAAALPSGPASSSAGGTPTSTVASSSPAMAAVPSSAAPAASTMPTATTVAKPTATKPTATKPAATPTGPPARTTPAKPTPAKPTPVKTTAANTTPAQTTPATTEPATPTPAKPTPAKPIPTSVKPTTVAPSTDAQGRLLCSDSVLRVTASTGAPAYTAGDRPILGVTVLNTGSVACTRDLSGPLQVFTVYTAAGARVWSTADCFPGEGTDVRTLPAGAEVHYNIKWSGTTSSPGCTGTRVEVPAGKYQARVTIGSLRATPADFLIN